MSVLTLQQKIERSERITEDGKAADELRMLHAQLLIGYRLLELVDAVSHSANQIARKLDALEGTLWSR